MLCDPVVLLFRCRDVTDGFDTISNKGKSVNFSSGPSGRIARVLVFSVLFPSLARSHHQSM